MDPAHGRRSRRRRAGRHGAVLQHQQPAARPPDLGDQIADLSRGTADLARQVAEMGRRLNAMETRVDKAVGRAQARSSRSPPRWASSARWCARSPRRSPPTPPPCRARAPCRRRRSSRAAEAGAARPPDGALNLSESDAVERRPPLPGPHARGHRRADRQGDRRGPHRSLSAADRHAAAAQGALLRGDVAAAHRGRRHRPGRRLHRVMPRASG